MFTFSTVRTKFVHLKLKNVYELVVNGFMKKSNTMFTLILKIT